MKDTEAFDSLAAYLYERGLSIRDICDGLQVSHGKVARSLKRSGVKMRTRSGTAWHKRINSLSRGLANAA